MWTAITLWLAHLAGITIYAAWAWSQVGAGAPWWPYAIGLPLVYMALVLVITLADFALAWIWRTPRAPAQRIGAARTIRMIAAEFWTLLFSGSRMMTYRWRLPDPAPAPAALPIVLVHGVLCNAGVWTGFARRLADAGIGPVYAVSYGPPLRAIGDFAQQLETCIAEALAATGAARAIVVTHSMGGLVARDHLRTLGARGAGHRIARVVTIGAPHHGSRFASLAPGACMAQMRPGNAWIGALPPAPADPPFVSLWSPHDSMVAPQASCVLVGAENFAFPGIGHNALLRDDAIFARVVAEIETARAAAISYQ